MGFVDLPANGWGEGARYQGPKVLYRHFGSRETAFGLSGYMGSNSLFSSAQNSRHTEASWLRKENITYSSSYFEL